MFKKAVSSAPASSNLDPKVRVAPELVLASLRDCKKSFDHSSLLPIPWYRAKIDCIKVGDNVTFDRSKQFTGEVIKRMGMRLRIRKTDGKEVWAEAKDVLTIHDPAALAEAYEAAAKTAAAEAEAVKKAADEAAAAKVISFHRLENYKIAILYSSLRMILAPGILGR